MNHMCEKKRKKVARFGCSTSMTRKNEERGITVRLNTQNLQSIINFIWTVADDFLINKFLDEEVAGRPEKY
jgi:hypothetical protein